MDSINQQQQHHYETTKEMLMKRLADASQYKIYPSIIPRNELPLRKILLTTRLWNHVRRQQAMLTMSSASGEWLFEQTTNNKIIPTNQDEKYSHKRRIIDDADDEPEQLQIKKTKPSNTNHFNDSPDSPAGPASSPSSSTSCSSTTSNTGC